MGISFQSTTGKVLAHVLANHLIPLSEEVLPVSVWFSSIQRHGQHDFCSTATARNYKEQGQPLYMDFIDLTKAFDSIDCPVLWSTLSWYGTINTIES